MSLAGALFDGLLVLLLLSVATLAFWHRRIFASAVFFIVFGLLLALAWLRLSAPDIALAEAAVGAGVTGALVIATLSRLSAQPSKSRKSQED